MTTGNLLPAIGAIRGAFEGQVRSLGGTVTGEFDDGRRLFLRSTLPESREVFPGDRLRAGVALRTQGTCVLVHPYVFRVVCRNGEILPRTLDTCSVERLEAWAGAGPCEEVLAQVRRAVRASADATAFARAVQGMRAAAEVEADELLEVLSALPRVLGRAVVESVLERFDREGDRTLFGLINAVTSTARDAPDPETRWRLEELGGGIAAGRVIVPRPGGEHGSASLTHATPGAAQRESSRPTRRAVLATVFR